VRVFAGGCVVEGCRIYDLRATNYSSVAISTGAVNDGIIVRNNIIKNINSLGNAALGDGNGLSRAISLGMTANATAQSIIENNYIHNIGGEEGDAITVVSSNASVYYDANTTIKNNTISNFNRRAIKIQANNVRVVDNYMTHNFATAAEIPNRMTVIDLVQGGGHSVAGNILDSCKFFTQISVFSISADAFSDFVIANNEISGIGAETSNTIISISPLGDNVTIKCNNITAGTGRAISVGGVNGCVISDNVINCTDNAAERVISASSTATKCIIKGNILMSGVRQCFIGFDSLNTIVVDNHVKANTPLFRNSAGNGNAVVSGNSIDGTAALFSLAESLKGNRISGNYYLQNQSIITPEPLYTTNSTGPTSAYAGMFVKAGQIVFDTSPTAGGYIGWTAIADGDAATVSWKQFGAILP
jgi:hypothetical protein